MPTPVKRRPPLGALAVALLLGLGAGAGLIWWHSARTNQAPPVHPRDRQEADFETGAGTDTARRRMEALAVALRRYRVEVGDNVRWPVELEDLKHLGLIAEDFSYMGELSRRPLTWSPDFPAGHDPSRWAICCDVQMGRRYDRRRGMARAPIAAVVITGDGEVRVLETEDLDSVGGLIFDAATR